MQELEDGGNEIGSDDVVIPGGRRAWDGEEGVAATSGEAEAGQPSLGDGEAATGLGDSDPGHRLPASSWCPSRGCGRGVQDGLLAFGKKRCEALQATAPPAPTAPLRSLTGSGVRCSGPVESRGGVGEASKPGGFMGDGSSAWSVSGEQRRSIAWLGGEGNMP